MRTYGFLFALALPLFFAGCDGDGIGPEAPDATGGEITFDIDFAGPENGDTRVATDALFNSAWEDGDEIGIFATVHGTPLDADDNYIHNLRLEYSSANGGSWTPDSPVYWPQDGTKLDFYACHPWDGEQNDPTDMAFRVHLDQRAVTEGRSNFNASDLLTAASDNEGDGFGKGATVTLTFSHALAMIQVNVDNGQGMLDMSVEPTVTLRGVKTSATFSLATGRAEVAPDDTAVDIIMHRTTAPGLVYRALVPAQTLVSGTSLFHITDGIAVLDSPPLENGIELEAGRAETFGEQVPLPHASPTVLFTDGSFISAAPNAEDKGDGLYEIDFGGTGERTVYSIKFRGKTHFIGRRDNETITLKTHPDTGELQFREAVNGKIPIGTYAELALIGTDATTLAGDYVQEAAIDLLGFIDADVFGVTDLTIVGDVSRLNWKPIRNFTGSYTGGLISNLYIDWVYENNVALFGSVGKGGALSDIEIGSGWIRGAGWVGSVCGGNSGTVTSCVNRSGVYGVRTVGGVCASNGDDDGTGGIFSCFNYGSVGSTEGFTGGVCGRNGTSITSCINYGEAVGLNELGGVCGQNDAGGVITECQNRGRVLSTGYNIGGVCGNNYGSLTGCPNRNRVQGLETVGGVCGRNSGGTISKCYNIESVRGTRTTTNQDTDVGGVCGGNWSGGTISECYNTGDIFGPVAIGGVVGKNAPGSVVKDSYHNGAAGAMISGVLAIGGVAGDNLGTVEHCHSTGTQVAGAAVVGGVCGFSRRGNIRGCYNESFVVGLSHVGGVVGANGAVLESSRNTARVETATEIIWPDDIEIIGDFEEKYYGFLGGIVGYNIGGTFEGEYTEESYSYTGKMIACYNTGAVVDTRGKRRVGGIAGYNRGNAAYIEGCYNTGVVTSSAPEAEINDYKDVKTTLGTNAGIMAVQLFYVNYGDLPSSLANSESYSSAFAADRWPAPDDDDEDTAWALYDEVAGTGYWKSLGSWNNSVPEFPKLYWEE